MTPRVSVFTPSHDPRYLDECYASLDAQTMSDWEWVVLLNGGAQWKRPDDERVIVRSATVTGVGALKARACEMARGELLVELDHDDVLATTALAQVVAAFDDHPEVGFVYSDCAQINADGSRNDDRFDEANGWVYYETEVDGREVQAVTALEPSPHNLAYIWYAPNHVRAFRREVYDDVGGYDTTRDILDDQDLMARLYQATRFWHIPECLYLQRVGHGGNTQSQSDTNARIQTETVALYDATIQPNALAWAAREGLVALDLGGAHNCPEGYVPVDIALSGEDVFETLAGYEDGEVGVVRAVDFLEHVADSVALLNEIHRVLAHGGLLLSLTPSTDGRGAWMDPTHTAFYNENSWWYWTNAEYSKYVPAIKGRFQSSRCFTFFPSAWHFENRISYVCANMIALKPGGARQGGYSLA